jgi:hypothetical protein
MALHRWNQIEWTKALEGMEARGVDVAAISERWGAPTDHGWADDDVILTDEEHQWVCGVLAGELAPSPIPD